VRILFLIISNSSTPHIRLTTYFSIFYFVGDEFEHYWSVRGILSPKKCHCYSLENSLLLVFLVHWGRNYCCLWYYRTDWWTDMDSWSSWWNNQLCPWVNAIFFNIVWWRQFPLVFYTCNVTSICRNMFGCRFPFVCISIGLTIGKVPTVGVVYNPIMDEVRFYKSHVSFRWPDITWNFKWLKFYVEHAEFTSFHIAWWFSTCMLDVSASFLAKWTLTSDH